MSRSKLVLAVMLACGSTAGIAHAAEPPSGVYFASAATLSLHSDVRPLDTTGAGGYPDVGLSLRLGAMVHGFIIGVGGEFAAMVWAPGAEYFSLFGGYHIGGASGTGLELTGEAGVHVFSNTGSIAGTYDVVSENQASRPFVGLRLALVGPTSFHGWWAGLFGQVRIDLGTDDVTSTLRMYCSGFPDGPDCTPGAMSMQSFSAGGHSLDIGFMLRQAF